jgi:phosphate transport system permease protein
VSTLAGSRREVFARRWIQIAGFSLAGLATAAVIAPVIWIVADIFVRGHSAITWDFLTQDPARQGKEGGIFPVIVGTFYLMIGTLIFAVPVGLQAAIYLSEYARPGRLLRLINLSIVNLAGVPSIVYGLFGLSLFVFTLNLKTSILAASLTLACQALALIITSSREAMVAVPREWREGALALGASRWQTTRHVVLPRAMPGILTGIMLAIGRAAGETAPILAVGVAFQLGKLPNSPDDQFLALPYHLYAIAIQVPGMPESRMWATALVLLAVVLAFNLGGIILRIYYGRRRQS